MSLWYRKTADTIAGPFSLEELRFLTLRGKLRPQDQLRQGLHGEWVTARSVKGLFSAAAKPLQRTSAPNGAAANGNGTSPAQAADASVAVAVETPDPADSHTSSDEPHVGETVQEPPPLPRGQQLDERRKRILIGSGIGTLSAILILLLLLLLRLPGSDEAGGGRGSVAGTGAGDSDAEGDGNAEGSQSGSEANERSRDTGAAASQSAAESRPTQSDTPAGEATPNDAPPTTLFTMRRIEHAPETPRPAANRRAAGGGRGAGLGDFDKRLAREGAKSGDVQISLIWNNVNDLDLHVICPSGERIFFQNRRGPSGGELDVDMNANLPWSNEPVENIYWPRDSAPKGQYQVFVHHYKNNGTADPTAFKVSVKANGRTKTLNGEVSAGQRPVLVHEFDVR